MDLGMTKSRAIGGHIDGRTAFVVCSKRRVRSRFGESNLLRSIFWGTFGDCRMTTLSIKALLAATATTALASSAFAQATAPTPWVLAPDMGYAYETNGKMVSDKMGTN